ncbi:MAG: SAM-dependent chlorinase/fluorinase [Marinifilaceae bacterium]|jgi:S-adenosylmethionine hydrolase|nr:SAM-dependent chlorinase/fluorinase [Marinifilaceae bacterium]
MRTITLTTDWKSNSHYQAIFKGKIITECPSVNIVDLCHDIDAFNISQAAFMIEQSYSYFPAQTIHVISVDIHNNKFDRFICARFKDQYFIGYDNGILNLIIKNEDCEFVEITKYNKKEYAASFPELEVFSFAVSSLCKTDKIYSLGKPVELVNRLLPIRPIMQEDRINGHVVNIDRYGNLLTNISKELFESYNAEYGFKIHLQSNNHIIEVISYDYNNHYEGEIIAVFNSSKMLELAMVKSNLSEALALYQNSDVVVTFNRL